MAAEQPSRYRHFILRGVTETEPYRSPQQGGRRSQVPDQDRAAHGARLLGQVDALKREAEVAGDTQRAAGMETGLGIRVEFESFPDIELAFESLAREQSKIDLLNVRHNDQQAVTYATVFVPEGKLDQFERLIREYLEEKRDSLGRPRDNKRLLNAIREVRRATLRALWTDAPELFPADNETPFWWEVWLPVRSERDVITQGFRERAAAQDIRVTAGELAFPERTVVLAQASPDQMRRSMVTLNSVAELRRAKETAEFFDSLPAVEQPEWLQDLLERSRHEPAGAPVPHVCLLDTGVSRGHPFLAPALDEADLHTLEPGWGVDDGDGHGTELAGLALGGNLAEILLEDGSIAFGHRLESVKLLRRDGENVGDARHHGHLTKEAVSRPEITAPDRSRVFSMAVTAKDNRDRGRPSAWSGAIDALASDSDNQGASPRLIMVAAGNVEDQNAWTEYPASNDTDGVHDPAQAWNALTIGAYTDLVRISEEDAGALQPIASGGGLSPFSTTSLSWQPHWPRKPDVVFEGGNAAKDALSAVTMPSLSLLTTHHRPTERVFTTTWATSAATAVGARMAAQIMAGYPDLWPETIRGLIAHSADWTDDMRRRYLPVSPSKRDYQNLVRRCGFGVPNLDRAVWSVDNSLTMVLQEHIRPFTREGSAAPKLRDMHLHSLPWPQQSLEALGATDVEMRVTLSYFIEPNPSERGVESRYRYESHSLRFDVKRPEESLGAFRARINAAVREEEAGTRSGGSADPAWLFGRQARHRGSLHCDVWRGTAARLASLGYLAVYPALGWWKTRQRLQCYDRAARYALIVSIRAPEVEVDLRTEIVSQIGIETEIDT